MLCLQRIKTKVQVAPDAGFEPATKRLTAAYSTAELIRNEVECKFYAKMKAMSSIYC